MSSSEHTATATATTATATATTTKEGSNASTAKLCDGCGKSFPSRNAIFKHLKDTDGSCLSKDDYQNYIRYVKTPKKFPKVVLLYGYLPSSSLKIRNGQDAGKILLQTIHQLQNETDRIDSNDGNSGNSNNDGNNNSDNTNIGDSTTTTTTNAVDDTSSSESSIYKINRSYGYYSRSAECVDQDKDTATQTEVMAVRLPPLSNKKGAGGGGVSSSSVVDDWLDQVQNKLDEKFQIQRQQQQQQENNDDYCHVHNITPIRIFGRQDMPNSKFNAETDVSFSRVERCFYVLLFTIIGVA